MYTRTISQYSNHARVGLRKGLFHVVCHSEWFCYATLFESSRISRTPALETDDGFFAPQGKTLVKYVLI
jgi:hypothetical protein